MFHLDLPNVYKVLNNGKFTLDETVSDSLGEGSSKDVRSQPIVVVSIFGSTWNQALRGTKLKRAFQLSLDAFGTVSLYGRNGACGHGANKGSGESTGTQKEKPHKADASHCDEDVECGETEPSGGESSGGGCVGESKEEKEEGGQQGGDHFHLNTKDDIGGCLEGFFYEDESVLFLHIEGLSYDAASCMEACQELRSSIRESGFLPVWSSFNTNYCKWLLLLFSLSHIMIMSETGNSFDTSYISLFRALDAVRQNVLSSVARVLSTIDQLPKQWIDHSRLCSPRLLFLFEIESANPTKIQNISSVMPCPVKERKEMLQNEIYQIFRKCRIITNISANSLFAIPANEDFVYVYDKSAQNSFSTNQSLTYTYLNWIGMSAKKVTSKSATASRSSSNTSLPVKMSFRAHQDALTYNDSVNSFRSFLMEHIAVALDRGFDDDYRRVSGSKHFFIRPTLGQWETAYNKLLDHLVLEPTSKRVSEAYFQMEKLLNVDFEYLEIQCAELFPKVYATYQRGLPEFYTAQQHQAKLTYAVNVFLNISRGPGVLPWLKKLASKCEKYWKNKRQQCETLNLLGHVCANPMHRVTRHDHLEIIPLPELDGDLPEMQHGSSTRITSYCNCGKRQGSREEPFTIRDANYEFYRKLGKDCCDKLEIYPFNVFAPSEENSSELSLQEMLVILKRKSESFSSINTLQERSAVSEYDLASPELAEVFESELRQEDGIEDESEESEEDDGGVDDANNERALFRNTDSEKLQELSVQDNNTIKTIYEESQQLNSIVKLKQENGMTLSDRSLIKRSSSTIEYLPGMFHSKSPAGLLTLFPSWSLLCLGPSSVYSHSHGVNQPGFLNGANALLPWDVKVKAHEGVTFAPPPRVFRGRRQSSRKSVASKATPTDEFSVKVFFGYEYECRKGHRFFCDSDTVLYALNYSNVNQKAIAGKVIGSDMPLYIYCPCKENRDVKQIAQLVRIHVVTPKAPVFVTLNPRVQPGPMGSCPIFFTGEDLIKLMPSTYWVLRLPFSYVGEVVYVPPTDVRRYNGRVLKGTFNVASMNPSETEEWEKQNQNRLQ